MNSTKTERIISKPKYPLFVPFLFAAIQVLALSFSNTARGAEGGRQTLNQYKAHRPKLLVVIVIDQFRSDFLTRFEKRLSQQKNGGLSRLMKMGAYFPFAKYDILQSVTCAGHASIMTGAYPVQNGIPLNDWYDVQLKKDVYCAEDSLSPIVGRTAKSDDGLSPRNLEGSTLGDEMKMAGHKSKIVTLALKDRAAIMMGGHRADLALWLEDGKWVSSKYYLPGATLPAWVVSLNASLAKEKNSIFKWKIQGAESGLSSAFNSTILHSVVAGSSDSFSGPYGVRITTDAAIRALTDLKLGQGKAPDILAVSYSSHDMLGHAKGLQALEMEEMTMFEDQSIGKLVAAVEKSVGLRNVVFAFTADHGVGPAVEAIKSTGMPAGTIDTNKILLEANEVLNRAFGTSSKGPWILRTKTFGFYLDPTVISDQKQKRADVENELRKFLLKQEGVATVFTFSDWEARRLPPGRIERQILKTYIPGKSADVILIPKPFWVPKGAFATHLTGYSYDRSVPLIIAGGGARAGVYARDAEVVDLAPTLSFIFGLVPPSGAEGRVLHEIFE